MDQHDVGEVRRRRSDLEKLRKKSLVLDERDRRLGMVGDILDLLRRERVVDADGRASGVNDPEVRDHVLGHVARHDQRELARAEAQLAQGHRHRRHLFAVAAPVQRLPVAVALPVQRRPLAPALLSVREDGADRLARDRVVDVGSFRDYVHPYLLTAGSSHTPSGHTLSLGGGCPVIYVRSRRSVVTLGPLSLFCALVFGALAIVATRLPEGWVAGVALGAGAVGASAVAIRAAVQLHAWPTNSLRFFPNPMVVVPARPHP